MTHTEEELSMITYAMMELERCFAEMKTTGKDEDSFRCNCLVAYAQKQTRVIMGCLNRL